ncbi:MAG: DUF2334 domain-containing protein [Balneola sp.]
MTTRLCTGLINPSNALISLLDSIGILYENVDFEKSLQDNFSLIIIEDSNAIDKVKLKLISGFVDTGKPILEISTNPFFYKHKISTSYSKTVFNSASDSEFDRIPYIDVYSLVARSSASQLLSGLVDIDNESADSIIGFLGLDLNRTLSQSRYTRKRFLSDYGEYPDELVSKADRAMISDVLELVIQRLFHNKKLPFIKKWHSPKKAPVFSFRIDSDYGTKESLNEIYTLLDAQNIKATWFLHVKAHENWLNFFKQFKNQELALHGYEHGYSSSFDKINSNISHGLKVLKNNGMDPKGFCAHYGIWNSQLNKALTNFEFEYTSEFTTGYDGNPFFQEDKLNLQIPVHPVCTGSLSRKRYTFDNIQNYFNSIYHLKKSLFKPIIFYHHPLQVALKVFKEIFNKVQSDDLTNLTFLEYAGFWKRRNEFTFSAILKDEEVILESNNPSFFLSISDSCNYFDIISSRSAVVSKQVTPTFEYEEFDVPLVKRQKALNQSRINLIKTDLVDRINRHKL